MSDNSFTYAPATAKASSLAIDIIQTVVIALAITVVIYLFIIIPSQVDGPSMQNNFMNGELLLTNKLISILGKTSLGQRFDYDYRRGDVVVFQEPGQKDPYIKRIIAGPGDTIMFKEHKFVVNGKVVNESYIPQTEDFRTDLPMKDSATLEEGVPLVIPENNYFLVGDNRRNSLDSRFKQVGLVERSSIKGRVFLRFWPINKLSIIKKGAFTETEL